MDIGSLLQSRGRGRTKAEVKRKPKRTADSRDATDNIGPVDGAAVPSVSSSMGSFDEDSVSATIVGCDGDSFIQKAMKVLDTNSFVVATSGNMDGDVQNGTDGLEEALEGTAVVHDDKTAKTNFQKDFLDQ